MQNPVLVFDLDGTLADTARDLIPVLNRVTATRGLPPVPASKIGNMVGHGAKAMLERAFAVNGVGLAASDLDELFDLYIADYTQNLAQNTVLFDGALLAMDRLAASGFTLSVCTNKTERLAIKLLASLGVLERFAALTGGDTFEWRKPDPRHLQDTVKMAGGMPQNAIMIGDSRTDIDTAKAARIPVIAVDFGYTDVPVHELGPDLVISHFDELEAAIHQIMRQRS